MFRISDVRYNLYLANEIRKLGYTVYCPNENKTINDKTRTDIKPENVYQADLLELESSNVFLCQVAEDSGTMWEAGYMDCLKKYSGKNTYLGVIGFASDIRLHTKPDPKKVGADNQAWALNAFISGGLKSSLGIYLSEEKLLEKLDELLEVQK